jgi:glutaredoxin
MEKSEMKRITWFYLEDCPYCAQAERALAELEQENPLYKEIPIDKIEENAHPEIVDRYDYHAVPCLWIGQDKLYEAHLFEKYEECREKVKRVLDKAMEA